MTDSFPVVSDNPQLVPVFPGQIGGRPAQVCDGRTLHTFLENDRQFADWIKQRIEQYGFQENQDFALISQKSEIKPGRGGDRRSRDYHLGLDMAKELSMVENNDKGRQARRYFIDCERRAMAAEQPTPINPEPPSIQSHFQGGRWLVHMDQRGNLIFNPVDREAFHVPASEFPAVISSAEFPSSLLPMVLSAAAGRMVGVFDRYQRRHGGPSSATRAIPQAQPAAEASGVLGLQDEAEFVLSRILNHRVRVQPDRGPAFLWSIGELARYGSGEPLTPPGRISYGEVNRALMAYGCRVSEDRQRLLISNTHPSVEARLRDTPGLSAGTRS